MTLSAVSGRGFLHLKGVVEGLLEALHIEDSLQIEAFRHELLDANRACELKLGGKRVGFLGELAPTGLKAFGIRGATAILEVDLAAIASRAKLVPSYQPQSPYPTIARDLT